VSFEPLFAVIDVTIFDRSGSPGKGAGMGVEKQKTLLLLSFHLEHYRKAVASTF
jgi:hypothetical protein